MSIEEAIQKMDAIINSLDVEFQKASEELAMSMLGLIVNRIQQQGLPGRSYSKNKLPEFYFFDRELNAGGRMLLERKARRKRREGLKSAGIKVKKNKTIDEDESGISYEEWRIANGLQVEHVDLTFTGRMFQNIGVIGTKKIGDYYVTVIGGKDLEVKQELDWNTQRFGRWFIPTDEERQILLKQFNGKINNYIKSIAA